MKNPGKALKLRWYLLLALTAAVMAWAGIDVLGPRQSDLREFDPESVAQLETDMWRAYYDRQQVRLFFQLAELLRTQYGVPFLRSNVIAFRGAKAAFIFKDGKNRNDYERALPDLIRFYDSIHRISTTEFDVNRAATFELEWWIIHRERDSHPRADLDRALAELQASLYNMPAERFLQHAQLRADAMLLRDARWESGEVRETDWETIHQLLRRSWRELWDVTHQVSQNPEITVHSQAWVWSSGACGGASPVRRRKPA